jgi:hypothetical protein
MSKLNPQNATAYVGPGVLRKGGKITPVPNGPLIKKKGIYAGSTLKSGGKIKKAQNGTSQYSDPKPLFDKIKKSKDSINDARIKLEEKKYKSKMKYLNGKLKNEQSIMNTKKAKTGASTTTTKTTNPIGVKFFKEGKNFKAQVTKNVGGRNATYEALSPNMDFAKELANKKALTRPADSLRTRKNGGMLKRADGSYSKRGLWDNIRANKGSGKKPTKQMLQQEKKIKAKTKK